MAEAKLRAFRYLGQHGPDNDRKGVLHIARPDGQTRVIFPGKTVKDPVNLAALGAARIAELVDSKEAQYLDFFEKLAAKDGIDSVFEQAGTIGHDSSEREVKATETAAQDARTRVDTMAAAAKTQAPASPASGGSMSPAGIVTQTAPASPAPATPAADDDILGGAPAGPGAGGAS